MITARGGRRGRAHRPDTHRPERLDRSLCDRGQALPMVLVFVVVFGAVIAALATSVDSGLKMVTSLRGQRSSLYSASAATDLVIEYLRTDSTLGNGVVACPTVSTPPTTYMQAVTVTCSNTGGTFAATRQIALTATVAGRTQVQASVLIHDDTIVAGAPTVDVLAWTYVR